MATSVFSRYAVGNTTVPLELPTLAGSSVNPGAASLASTALGTLYGERLGQAVDDHTFTAAIAPITSVFKLKAMDPSSIPKLTQCACLKPVRNSKDANEWEVISPNAPFEIDHILGVVVGKCRGGGRTERGMERWHITLGLENVCTVEFSMNTQGTSYTVTRFDDTDDTYEGKILQIGNRYITLIKPQSSEVRQNILYQTWSACLHAGHFEGNVGICTTPNPKDRSSSAASFKSRPAVPASASSVTFNPPAKPPAKVPQMHQIKIMPEGNTGVSPEITGRKRKGRDTGSSRKLKKRSPPESQKLLGADGKK